MTPSTEMDTVKTGKDIKDGKGLTIHRRYGENGRIDQTNKI